jgi:hypothetical protein
MLTVIGLKKLTKLYLDEFCLGITRSFRFLSDHFLPRFASHQVPPGLYTRTRRKDGGFSRPDIKWMDIMVHLNNFKKINEQKLFRETTKNKEINLLQIKIDHPSFK